MASQKSLEKPLSVAERRARKFLAERIRDGEARHKAYLDTLDPRQREALSFEAGEE
jgi:hypothetical protein